MLLGHLAADKFAEQCLVFGVQRLTEFPKRYDNIVQIAVHVIRYFLNLGHFRTGHDLSAFHLYWLELVHLDFEVLVFLIQVGEADFPVFQDRLLKICVSDF